MSKKGKSITVLLILLAGASIAVSGIIYLSLKKERDQAITLSKKVSRLESDKSALEKKIEEYESDLSKAVAKLNQSEKRIKELMFSLDTETRKTEKATSQLASLQEELAEVKNTKADLEKRISQGQEEIGSFKDQIAELKQAKEELEEKVERIVSETGIELGTIVIASEPASDTEDIAEEEDLLVDLLQGRILVINKEYAFVVINLGSQDGVSSGDVFSIYQKNKYIGDIIVERVDEAVSSANFASSRLKNIARENDKIVSKLK